MRSATTVCPPSGFSKQTVRCSSGPPCRYSFHYRKLRTVQLCKGWGRSVKIDRIAAKDVYSSRLFKIGKGYHDITLHPGIPADATIKECRIISIVRTKLIEKLFKWESPILSTMVSIIARKQHSVNLSDLSALNSYQIITVHKNNSAVLLKINAVRESSIYSTHSPMSSARMLAHSRVDL